MSLKVSIVTPSLNQGRFIEETILSVQHQEYRPIEHVVMDGGSNDETRSILQKCNGQLIWKSERDNGQSHAINKGLKLASGDILAYLNADDTYLPHTVETVVDYFEKHPDVDFVYGDFNIINEEGQIIGANRGLRYEYPMFFHLATIIPQPTVFFRRRLLEKTGFFDESLHYCMDYDLWLRMARHGQMVHLAVVLANYRWHGGSKSWRHRSQMLRERRLVWERYAPRPFSSRMLQNLYRFVTWTYHKSRRIVLKLIQGKYFCAPPQTWVGRRVD